MACGGSCFWKELDGKGVMMIARSIKACKRQRYHYKRGRGSIGGERCGHWCS